jgi:Arc/MetJ-type ribon-helix-helix transcriptional regulator
MSNLSPEIEQYIQVQLATGAFRNRDDLIEQVLHRWKKQEEDRAYIAREVSRGIEQAERGEFDELDMNEIIADVNARLDAEDFPK